MSGKDAPELAQTVPGDVYEKYRIEREKRLRSDGISQYIPTKGEFGAFEQDPYADPDFTRSPVTKDVEIALIGAGFATILAGTRLRQAGFEDICVIEKAGDFGGTWYWNRYPGAQCDIEAYIYLPLLEEMGYMPNHRYAFGPEIRSYAQSIARKFDLYRGALFQTSVTGMEWDSDDDRWVIRTDRGDIVRARYVAMAQGPLSNPKLPGISGIADFKGEMFHTSRWNYGYTGGNEYDGFNKFGDLPDLADKTVGIIGTGATAVQVVPHLAQSAKQLYVFQRTPAAVDTRNNRQTDESWARSLPAGWQDERRRNFEALVSGGEQSKDLVADGWTDTFRRLTGVAARQVQKTLGRKLTAEERRKVLERADFECMDRIRQRVDNVVQDPDTADSLKPWYKRWCKRPGFHDEYLDAFNRSNVKLVDTRGKGVSALTEHEAIVEGESYPIDCLIFATGFEVGTSYTSRAGFDIVGRDGVKLSDKWGEGFRTFHGMFVEGFPNLFILGLTQSGYTINYTHALDEQGQHLAHLLSTMLSRGATMVEATKEAEDDWVAEIERLARRGAEDYYKDCTPSYTTNEGDVGSMKSMGFTSGAYGAGALNFFEVLKGWREDGSLAGLKVE